MLSKLKIGFQFQKWLYIKTEKVNSPASLSQMDRFLLVMVNEFGTYFDQLQLAYLLQCQLELQYQLNQQRISQTALH